MKNINTARDLVLDRLDRLVRIEKRKPGSIKRTTMLAAFIRAVE